MREISAPFLVFLAFVGSACGPRLPGLEAAAPPADAGAEGGLRQDAALRGSPPDAPARVDAAPYEARADTPVETRADAGAAEARPDAGPLETRPDTPAAEARAETSPEAAAAETRPEAPTPDARPEAPLAEAGAHDVPEAGAHDAPEAGAHDAPEAGAHDAPEAGAHDATPERSPARAPRFQEVRIVEVMIDPAGNDLGHEWFELVNVTAEALALTGLHVADGVTDAAVEAGVLAPGARLVLGQSLDRARNGDAPVDVVYGTKLALNNDTDTVSVCLGACADGVVLASFTWLAPFGPAFAGHAVSIDLPAGTTCPGATPYGADGNFGTPGQPNPPCP
jgi:hypothetical protein